MAHEIHPAAFILPELTPEEWLALRDSIQAHGMLEPILLYQGLIIDGRARIHACEQLGIEPHFADAVVPINPQDDVPDDIRFVVETNLPHRNLSVAQRVACALELRPGMHEAAIARRGRHGKGITNENKHERGITAVKLAELFGVARNSYERAVRIQKAKPSLIPRMKAGEIPSIDAAMREAGVGGSRRRRWVASREDNFYDIFGMTFRYLEFWGERGLQHINPREARKRLERIEALKEQLAEMEEELSKRAVKARTTGV